MKHKALIQESAGKLARVDGGAYRVTLITEGEGSRGRYSADLIRNSAHVFEGAPSFINHPVDFAHPENRDLNTIAGRITDVHVGEDNGKVALIGYYSPRWEYSSLFEQFGDIIGLSIFCLGDGTQLPDGRVNVESFQADYEYRSVDAVIAAGAGGRFQLAESALAAAQSSLGRAEGAQPGPASVPGHNPTQEDRMDPEEQKAFAKAVATAIVESLKPITDFVAEHRAAADAAAAGAKPGADADEAGVAIENAIADLAKIEDAKLTSKTLKESLVKAVKAGEDITEALAFAVSVQAESGVPADSGTILAEGAASASKHSFAVTGLAGR